MKMLAVFPPLHEDNAGGVQVAGRIAWQALEQCADATLLEVSARRRLRAVRHARSQRADFDIVLFWHLDLLRLAPLLPRRARRVVFLHGIEAWRRPDLLTRVLLRNTRIFANSQYTAQRARLYLHAAGMDIVPLGLGDATGTTAPPAEPPVAIMIARMDAGERYKGHHEVIAAWSQVQQMVAGAQLWIVGEGDLRDELQAEVQERQLDGAVRFFGRVSEPEKEALLRAARVLVLPSRGEGFGLVYLEAMRAGRPCLVGTDAGAEVVNPPEAGVSVDPSNTQALVQAIARLLQPGPEWQHMSEAARRRHAEHFTAAHFQSRLVAALRGLN
jgi:phosphatidylinositol alpha-1,6-mannosyltransferase